MKIRDYINAGKSKDEIFNFIIYVFPIYILKLLLEDFVFSSNFLDNAIKHVWPALLLLIVIIIFYLILINLLFLLFGFILYLFSRSENFEKMVKRVLIFLLLLPFISFFFVKLFELFGFISFKAQDNVLTTAYVFVGIGVVVTLIVIFRSYIVKFFKYIGSAISDFRKSENYLKVIPLGFTFLSVCYYYGLISKEAEKMKFSIDYNDNVVIYALCLAIVPFLVYFLSGTIFYKIYDRFKSDKLKIIIKVINIIIYIIAFFFVGSFIVKTFNFNMFSSSSVLLYFAFLLGLEILFAVLTIRSAMELIRIVRDI